MQAQTPMQPQLRKYIYQKAARSRTPVSGTFELTPRCNMNCRMCYIRMSEEEMNARGRAVPQKGFSEDIYRIEKAGAPDIDQYKWNADRSGDRRMAERRPAYADECYALWEQ